MITHGDDSLRIDEAESAGETPGGPPDIAFSAFNWHEMAAMLRADASRSGVKHYVTFEHELNRWAIWRTAAPETPLVTQGVLS